MDFAAGPSVLPLGIAIFCIAIVALWTYFALSIAPPLWNSNRRLLGFLLALVGTLYVLVLVHFLTSGWLGDPKNTTAIEALTATAGLAVTVALVFLTFRTVEANRDMARETERIAAATVQQQRAATRPALVFRIHPASDREGMPLVHKFAIEVFNVGAGPALNTRIRLEGPMSYKVKEGPTQPVVLAPLFMGPDAEKIAIWFELQEDDPFRDIGNPMRWPRSEDDAELVAKLAKLRESWRGRPVTMGSAEYRIRENEIDPVRKEVSVRRAIYEIDLANQTAERQDVGRILAEYDDLAESPHVSSAAVQVAVREKDQWDLGVTEGDFDNFPYPTPNWAPVVLGPMLVDPVTVAMSSTSDLVVAAVVDRVS